MNNDKMIEDFNNSLSQKISNFVDKLRSNFTKELEETKEELTFVEKKPL